MILVDSSGWLEFFADGKNAKYFSDAIENTNELLVSTINIYEVFKRILQQRDENSAIQAVALLHQGFVIDVDSEIALMAGKISIEYKIPLADSMIYATAQKNNAILLTQDVDFKGLSDVSYFKK